MGEREKIAEQKARLKIPQAFWPAIEVYGSITIMPQHPQSADHEQKQIFFDGSATRNSHLVFSSSILMAVVGSS